jgi:hypothetical protein
MTCIGAGLLRMLRKLDLAKDKALPFKDFRAYTRAGHEVRRIERLLAAGLIVPVGESGNDLDLSGSAASIVALSDVKFRLTKAGEVASVLGEVEFDVFKVLCPVRDPEK